jgi:hypothetical protein
MALLNPARGRRFAPGRSRRLRCGLGLAVWWLAGGLGAAAQPVALEYQLKAVFLFNFAQFVDWPPRAFANRGSSLVIGVLGDDPFGPYLTETVRDETVHHRPLVVEHYRRVEEVKDCHVLFISRSETAQWGRIFAGLKGRNILTVSDADGFAEHGGMIRFVTENNKIRFRINLAAVKAADLTISSQLLRPAEIVRTGGG